MNANNQSHTIIIGGGLAGLTAATILARSGQSVTLFEKARKVGGRATTQDKAGFLFNQGPHALYAGSIGVSVLRDLDIKFTGGQPNVNGVGLIDGRLEQLLTSPKSMLSSRLLSWTAKLEFVRIVSRLPRLDLAPLQGVSVREWVEQTTQRLDVQQVLYALFRLTTYAADIDRHSAGAALQQLQFALKDNVYYLDGGWQTLVEGLWQAAQDAGVQIVSGTNVRTVNYTNVVQGITLDDGTFHAAANVIAAVSPRALQEMVAAGGAIDLAKWLTDAPPIHAACLDVALRRLPKPDATFALGIDVPLYLSVHSAAAQLTPADGALVHVAKYLQGDQRDNDTTRRQLTDILDKVQPGWQDEVVSQRFLPHITVSNALVTAKQGGLAGRPGPGVAEIANLYVAGDWVGDQGMLADASLASAQAAAQIVLNQDATIRTEPPMMAKAA